MDEGCGRQARVRSKFKRMKRIPTQTLKDQSSSSNVESTTNVIAYVVLMNSRDHLQLVLHAHPNNRTAIKSVITNESDYISLLDTVRWELFRTGQTVVPHTNPHPRLGSGAKPWAGSLTLLDRVQLGPTVAQRYPGPLPTVRTHRLARMEVPVHTAWQHAGIFGLHQCSCGQSQRNCLRWPVRTLYCMWIHPETKPQVVSLQFTDWCGDVLDMGLPNRGTRCFGRRQRSQASASTAARRSTRCAARAKSTGGNDIPTIF